MNRKIKRFFANPKKVSRLKHALKVKQKNVKEQRVYGQTAYLVNVGGKKRFIKLNSAQQVQRENLKRLFSSHNQAVRSGLISPKNYSLVPSNIFIYADHRVGVMENVGGISLEDLRNAAGNARQERRVYKSSKGADLFVKKNPKITYSLVFDIQDELARNLQTVFNSRKQADIAFDVKGDNLRVMGVDKKTGKLVIKLFDQVPPNGIKDFGVDMHKSVNGLALKYGLKKRKQEYIE